MRIAISNRLTRGFFALADVRDKLESWRYDYNQGVRMTRCMSIRDGLRTALNGYRAASPESTPGACGKTRYGPNF